MIRNWYFTCMDDVAKKFMNNEFDILSDSIEVYSNMKLAVEMSHPGDTYMFKMEIDDNDILTRAFISLTDSIALINNNVFHRLHYVDGVLKIERQKKSRRNNPIVPPESVLDKYDRIIEFTYAKYLEQKDDIEYGFISGERISWLIDRLYLKDSTDEQLNEYWFAIDRFFRSFMMEKDDKDEWKWKTNVDIRWYMDCDSAWKEVINHVARSRRGE